MLSHVNQASHFVLYLLLFESDNHKFYVIKKKKYPKVFDDLYNNKNDLTLDSTKKQYTLQICFHACFPLDSIPVGSRVKFPT